MIRNLYIENYALIEKLNLSLFDGFSTITGETGAGKSIILGALSLLRGQRADTKAIKNGAKKCVVEARFAVAGYGLDDFFADNDLDFDGEECILRREITAAGKSRAFVNDTPVQLATLKAIGEKLVDIHSQHQNLLVNNENFLLGILDIIGAAKNTLDIYQTLYKDMVKAGRERDEAVEMAAKARQEEDFIRYQYDQLVEAALDDPDEVALLEEESEMLAHAEDIKVALFKSANGMSGDGESNVLSILHECLSSVASVESVFPKVEDVYSRLNSCYIEIKDIANDIESLAETVDYDPQRLQWVDDRLNTIYSLLKKNRVETLGELIALRDSYKQKLQLVENSDEALAAVNLRYQQAMEKAQKAAETLTELRCGVARTLEKKMVEMLQPLGMPNVKFSVELSDTPSLGINGKDKVEFMFSANKNAPVQNLASIASGGEIARVMLSLKALIAGAVKMPTIIFDEIDTGVSGSIAEKMARIMKMMGNANRQVISITHLPQIAAMGKYHYKVYKTDNSEATVSHIKMLDESERVGEIANMLSGEVLTDAAMENARELLRTAAAD